MKFLLLSYVAGMLTILSPCILPVLPFIFARTGQPFTKGILPLLAGMALTFAAVASLAAAGGAWVASANEYGRWAALALMALFGLTLLLPGLSDRLMHPLTQLGNRLSNNLQGRDTALASLGLGVATGLLWAPCAGPILGVVLTGAALQGTNLRLLLLVAYGVGAATSLGVIGFVGGSIFRLAKKSLGVGAWIRRVLGVVVIACVAMIAFGLDTTLLSSAGNNRSAKIEQALLDNSGVIPAQPAWTKPTAPPKAGAPAAPSAPMAPSIDGAVAWLNSPPLTLEGLRGHVVLIDFWTYSCINCLRTLPYVQGWADRYAKDGLVVIGVHTPEFAFEKQVDNVRDAVKRLHLTYPIAIDSDYKIWRAYNNNYWPAHYLIDAQGHLRDHHFGEGNYEETEHAIQSLLAESGHPVANTALSAATAAGSGAEQAADNADLSSPETYIGYGRRENFVSASGSAKDVPFVYTCPDRLDLNQWCLKGHWIVQEDKAIAALPASIRFHFHARDVHMVMGGQTDGKALKFRVSIDGKSPGVNHGSDVGADGTGAVSDHRLYQLIRLNGPVSDHEIEIQFLDPAVQIFTFTFG